MIPKNQLARFIQHKRILDLDSKYRYLLYLNQEPVDFDTGPDVKFKKKVILFGESFRFYMGLFRENVFFSYFEIFVEYI